MSDSDVLLSFCVLPNVFVAASNRGGVRTWVRRLLGSPVVWVKTFFFDMYCELKVFFCSCGLQFAGG